MEIQIFYVTDDTDYYWYELTSDWVEYEVSMQCTLGSGYIKSWSFNSENVDWIPGEEYYVMATATDEFGCSRSDTNTFEITET